MDDEMRLHAMNTNTQEKVNKSRERSDKISALMGQYMLKGYRMLGSACHVCGNVLLKYRNQDDYCVACKEVDVYPQSVTQAGNRSVTASSQGQQYGCNSNIERGRPFDNPVRTELTPVERSVRSSVEQASMTQDAIQTAVSSINEKIVWASKALSTCQSTGECIQLCELLKTFAETLKTLKGIDQIEHQC